MKDTSDVIGHFASDSMPPRVADPVQSPLSDARPVVPPQSELENGRSVEQLESPAWGRLPTDPAPSSPKDRTKMEIPKPVDQLTRVVEETVSPAVKSGSTVGPVVRHPAIALIVARPELFARQGSVSSTWRHRNGVTFGPYFRLSYRENGRQYAIYLGREGPLVQRVRLLLQNTQNPLRQKRIFDRIERETRSALRANNARLATLLRPLGLRLKGFEVRGWRTSLLRPCLSPKSTHSARQQSLATDRAGSGHPHERAVYATPLQRLV